MVMRSREGEFNHDVYSQTVCLSREQERLWGRKEFRIYSAFTISNLLSLDGNLISILPGSLDEDVAQACPAGRKLKPITAWCHSEEHSGYLYKPETTAFEIQKKIGYTCIWVHSCAGAKCKFVSVCNGSNSIIPEKSNILIICKIHLLIYLGIRTSFKINE